MISSVLSKALPALRFVLNLGTGLFKHAKADSLVSFTQSTRVEPITIIDQRAVTLPYMHDVLQALSSIFTGYYLQAVSLLVNVGNINVVKLLDSLSPSRDYKDAMNSKVSEHIQTGHPSLLSFESYKFALPVPAETASLEDHDTMIEAELAREEAMRRAQKVLDTADEVMTDYVDPVTGRSALNDLHSKAAQTVNYTEVVGKDKDGNPILAEKQGHGKVGEFVMKEATNLSVGKMVEVTVEQGQHKATFPITVRLIATLMPSNILAHILGDGSRDITARERFHAWRAGQLEFWRDLVLCQDLIDQRKKALIKDDTGAYAEILARRAGNSAAGLISGTPSVGTASNLVVMTTQTAKELEAAIGGHLKDARVRNKVFTNTYIMIMVVIDPEWEQITIYHRGIALPTKLSVKELKVANKGTGPDVAEILKAYMLGNQPNL